MQGEYQYISRPAELLRFFSSDDIVAQKVEFVAVLTRIVFTPSTSCVLMLQNFEHGRDDRIPYVVKLPCRTWEQSQLVAIVLKLLMHGFGLDTEKVGDESGFDLADIHIKHLCFARCRGKFITNDKNGSILLDEILGIDIDKELRNEAAGSQRLSNEDWGVVNKITDNLIRLDRDSSHRFNFNNLAHSTRQFIDYLKYRTERLTQVDLRMNPMFGANQLLCMKESQDDFNSQQDDPYFNSAEQLHTGFSLPNPLEETAAVSSGYPQGVVTEPKADSPSVELPSTEHGRSYTRDERPVLSMQPISRIMQLTNSSKRKQMPHSPLSTHSAPCDGTNKRPTLPLVPDDATGKRKRTSTTAGVVETALTIDTLENSEEGKLVSTTGFIAGLYPNVYEECVPRGSSFILYFPLTTADTCEVQDPAKNCIEIYSSDIDYVLQQYDIDHNMDRKEALILLNSRLDKLEVRLSITKAKLFFSDSTYSFCWELKALQVNAETLTQFTSIKMPNPLPERGNALSIDQLSATTSSATIFAMLICARVDPGSKVHHFSFTDFTENLLISCKLDPYLNDYCNRLKATECIYVKSYPEYIHNLDAYTLRHYNRRLVDCHNGRDTNLTNFGMVFRLKLDVKSYQQRINGIIREAVLITGDTRFTGDEERLLEAFYNRAFQRIENKCFFHNYKRYKVCFPINSLGERNSRLPVPSLLAHTLTLPAECVCARIPAANSDVASHSIKVFSSIAELQSNPLSSEGVLYLLKGKILSTVVDSSKATIYITNDAKLQEEVSVRGFLRLQILGEANVSYFCGADEASTDVLQALNLRAFKFYLLPGEVQISPSKTARVWCPVECSIEELNSQLQLSDNLVKLEQHTCNN
ncbi:ABL155Cp [Eremothecium gossypii ATCC 10895]|uniref:ABL155Cp n=1 Tax=Eremothecium gossypii (strain ATCC 10895 / CBS 109.51 / FGSC 9923 / NRRL Y-1056) TaxID=284811 RepID=Q75E25_EREGS|nr:ABL155Cp [Eremothecium gossypii ATCC 10895]AAS50616.1 ABL155Cp [Eremothecium gossypii ATCC 10895]AEY94904.1 FABL155Cp [Eremothecium gossypii FDAG1]